jgi:hypothetical protein
VGDLTSTLFRSPSDTRVPPLPPIVIPTSRACDSTDQDTELGGAATPVPTEQRMPNQQGGSTPASYYFGPSPKTPARSKKARPKKKHRKRRHKHKVRPKAGTKSRRPHRAT